MTFAAPIATLADAQAYLIVFIVAGVGVYAAWESAAMSRHLAGFFTGLVAAAFGGAAGWLLTNDVPTGAVGGGAVLVLAAAMNLFNGARRYETWPWAILAIGGVGAIGLFSSLDIAAFALFAAIILFGAFKTITTKEIVHATVWLASTLFGVAGLFLSLGDPFLAMIQVLVYVGAVITLFLFTVMLTIPLKEDISLQGLELPMGVTIERIEDLDPETPLYGHGPMKAFHDTNPRKPVAPPATLSGVALDDNVWGTGTTVRRHLKKPAEKKEE
ncbi:MAG: NADH-quinone oxidoreductase subunit J family protein [Thermoplasmatota archaeon]